MQVLDYSGGYPRATEIRRAGFGGAVRYLRKEGSSRVQPITAGEYESFKRNGLSVALVYQAVSTGRVLEGSNAGAHDAEWALARARDIGIADPRCIYFAVDRDIVGESQLQQVGRYFEGVATVLDKSRIGVYGENDVVNYIVPTYGKYGWQTAAWSRGEHSDKARLYQLVDKRVVDGIGCDINNTLDPDWGQDDYKGDEMTQEQYDKIMARFDNLEGFVAYGGPDTADGELPGISPDSAIGRLKDLEVAVHGVQAPKLDPAFARLVAIELIQILSGSRQ